MVYVMLWQSAQIERVSCHGQPLYLTPYPAHLFHQFCHVAAMVWYTFCEMYGKDSAPDICRCEVGGIFYLPNQPVSSLLSMVPRFVTLGRL